MKLNSILDEEFVEALYKASMAGVKIELVVRGICAIKPGVPGLSENIKVVSILGRFLEHSRIIHFCNNGEDELWIGSADLMHRNLDRRVESMVKIVQVDHKRLLMRAIETYLSPTMSHWSMEQNGEWTHKQFSETGERLQDLHAASIQWYRERG